MSGNDFRGEQELSELARLLPVPAARDLPAGRQRILQEHLMTEIHQMEPKSHPRAVSPGRKRRYGLVAVGASTALAAAAAATVFMTGQGAPARPTTAPTPTAPETAAVLLAKVADAAASQPAPTVRDNQFMYIRSEESDQAAQKPYERQVWLPVANICVTGLLKEGGSTELLSPFAIMVNPDGSEKVEYPSKPSDWKFYTFRCPSEGHLYGVSYRLLQSLPTNPSALLNWLKSQKQYTNDGPLQEIFETLGENIMPPAVAAAFYRLAAQLPGATLVPDATNVAGQHGIGVTWPSPNPGRVDQYELIFNKTTLQNIGEKQFDAKTGKVDFEVAIQQRAFVDKAGELP